MPSRLGEDGIQSRLAFEAFNQPRQHHATFLFRACYDGPRHERLRAGAPAASVRGYAAAREILFHLAHAGQSVKKLLQQGRLLSDGSEDRGRAWPLAWAR